MSAWITLFSNPNDCDFVQAWELGAYWHPPLTEDQWGKFIEINVTDENRQTILTETLKPAEDAYGSIVRGELYTADHVYLQASGAHIKLQDANPETERICKRCKTAVQPSQVTGYQFYCPEHDEDLYEFETEEQLKAKNQKGESCGGVHVYDETRVSVSNGSIVSDATTEASMGYKVDFKTLAQNIDIGEVAAHLNLVVKKERAACPACQGSDGRDLQIFAETNSFRCHSAAVSGDCIALYAHCNGTGMYKAALTLTELFGTTDGGRQTAPTTAPQKPGGSPSPSASMAAAPVRKEREPFDPDAYAAKLVYNDDVAALGLSEGDAQRLQIGYASNGLLKNRVAIPVRDITGKILGFIGYQESGNPVLKLPEKWLPSDNIVRLRCA